MSILERTRAAAIQSIKFIRTQLGQDAPRVPLVRMDGVIVASSQTGTVLNLQRVEKLLDKAFDMSKAPVVAISINSPGGSPVQSRLIHERIRLLSKQKEKPVLVFCEDLAASGGYMIACAGDEIFADPASIVGSIGVINAGFGFTDLMEKYGVERRVRTAGKSKSLGDPFMKETKEQKERMTRLLEAIHTQFINLVKSARGGALNEEIELFDGSVFTGEEGIEAGLVDGIGETRSVLEERYGEDVRIKVLSPSKGGMLGRLTGSVIESLEHRQIWARYGL